jgi:hypothetical protein
LIAGRKYLFSVNDLAKRIWSNTVIRNITHYSYFGAFRSDVSNVGANAAMLTQDGKLTDIGSWYMGGAATNNVPEASGASALGAAPSAFALSLVVMAWAYFA